MPLDILVNYLGILAAITLLLFGGVILLRIRADARNRHYEKRAKEWERLLFGVLTGEPAEALSQNVALWEYRAFSEYMSKPLANLAGEPLQKLTDMCRRMGLQRYHLFMLRLGDEWQRIYAAHFLGLLQIEEARSLLREHLKDGSFGAAFASACALARLGEKGAVVGALRRKDWNLSITVTLLLGYGPRIGETLMEILSTRDMPCDRLYVLVDFIGFLRFLPAEKLIADILKENRDEELSIRCVKTLGLLGSSNSFYILKDCLLSKNWVVRCQAAKSLGSLKAAFATGDIERCLKDSSWQVRHNAAFALLRLGEKGIAILKRHADTEAICRQVIAEWELLGSLRT